MKAIPVTVIASALEAEAARKKPRAGRIKLLEDLAAAAIDVVEVEKIGHGGLIDAAKEHGVGRGGLVLGLLGRVTGSEAK